MTAFAFVLLLGALMAEGLTAVNALSAQRQDVLQVAGNRVQTPPDEALHDAALKQAAGAVDKAAPEVERGHHHRDRREDGVEQGSIVRACGLGGYLDGDVCGN